MEIQPAWNTLKHPWLASIPPSIYKIPKIQSSRGETFILVFLSRRTLLQRISVFPITPRFPPTHTLYKLDATYHPLATERLHTSPPLVHKHVHRDIRRGGGKKGERGGKKCICRPSLPRLAWQGESSSVNPA